MSLKFSPPLAVAYELRQRALKEGRSLGDMILRLVESALAASQPIEIENGKIDKIERGTRGKATAAWLSPPIASAIQSLAQELGRSQSWIVRDLLRTELRRRGVLPLTGADTAVTD
jgi:hypothetical protein